MQFQVPQFLEVEAKIFGPLTIKQFVYLAGAAGVVFIVYTLTKSFFLTFVICAPVIVFALVLAFKKVNNKPFSYILEAAIKYFFSKKLYLWKKSNKPMKEYDDSEINAIQNMSIPRSRENNLKEMAWRLNVSGNTNATFETPKIKNNEVKSFVNEEKMVKAYSNLGKNISRMRVK